MAKLRLNTTYLLQTNGDLTIEREDIECSDDYLTVFTEVHYFINVDGNVFDVNFEEMAKGLRFCLRLAGWDHVLADIDALETELDRAA